MVFEYVPLVIVSVAPSNGYAHAPHSLFTVTARSVSVTFAPLRAVIAYTPSAAIAASFCVQSMTPFLIVTSPLFTSNTLPLPVVPVRVRVLPARSIVSAVFAPRFGSTRASSVRFLSSVTVLPSEAAATAPASVE